MPYYFVGVPPVVMVFCALLTLAALLFALPAFPARLRKLIGGAGVAVTFVFMVLSLVPYYCGYCNSWWSCWLSGCF